LDLRDFFCALERRIVALKTAFWFEARDVRVLGAGAAGNTIIVYVFALLVRRETTFTEVPDAGRVGRMPMGTRK
jgi:hypothetical protein